jgi:hypothetical protein
LEDHCGTPKDFAAGGAHYCFDHHKVGGIIFPTYRRVLGRDPKAEEPESSAPVGVEVRTSDIEINKEIAQSSHFK